MCTSASSVIWLSAVAILSAISSSADGVLVASAACAFSVMRAGALAVVSGAVGGGPPVGDVGETVCLLILATIMKHTLLFIKDWLHSFLSLLFPRCCIVCGRPLSKGEECLCTICNITLPRTNCHLRKDNPVERLFWEQIPLERAPLFSSTGKGVISGRFFIS